MPGVPRLGRTATAQGPPGVKTTARLKCPGGQAALRRSATMAGNSISGSLPRNSPGLASVNRRARKGPNQRTQDLQRPLLLFTKTRI